MSNVIHKNVLKFWILKLLKINEALVCFQRVKTERTLVETRVSLSRLHLSFRAPTLDSLTQVFSDTSSWLLSVCVGKEKRENKNNMFHYVLLHPSPAADKCPELFTTKAATFCPTWIMQNHCPLALFILVGRGLFILWQTLHRWCLQGPSLFNLTPLAFCVCSPACVFHYRQRQQIEGGCFLKILTRYSPSLIEV